MINILRCIVMHVLYNMYYIKVRIQIRYNTIYIICITIILFISEIYIN